MIVYLNDINVALADEILAIQIPSYNIEATLIGFSEIPQLKDSVDSIMMSGESFIGYRLEHEWAGFLSYSVEKDTMEICRLVVHPRHFRKGVGGKLIKASLALASGKKITVSTGSENQPALNLYQHFGFEKVNEIEIAPGVLLSLLERTVNDKELT